MLKRFFDIVFSSFGLIFLSPLFAMAAFLIRVESKGPVFFTQKRIGKGFKPFVLYKFRAMVANTPKTREPITATNDPRVTKIGKILRKTKIHELPQLINVLKGNMSLVGPRPEVRRYVSKYRRDYREILKLRPGITDVAWLTYRNEESLLKQKNNPEEYYLHVLLPEKIRLAKEYVKRASLLYDLRLILLTLFKLVYPQQRIITIIKFMTPYRRPIVIGMQLGIFILSSYLAFFLRYDGDVPSSQLTLFFKYLPVLIVLRMIFLFGFSLDRGLWRYASVRDLLSITAAVSCGSLLFFLSLTYLFGEVEYPRSIYEKDWFLNIFLLGGIRLFRRLHEKSNGGRAGSKRVIVVGAGDAAEMLLRDIESSHFYSYEVVGLVDDDRRKKGLKIRGIHILGSRKELPSILEKEDMDEFVIAMPSAPPSKLQAIVRDLRQYGKPIKTLPGLWGVLGGKDSIGQIKILEPEDVLFRAPVYEGHGDLKTFFEGKNVMVTGAGGSIGSELSRQIASFKPGALILFEKHEESLYKIHQELRSSQQATFSQLFCLLGDILDEKRLMEVMDQFRPEIVFHAAAYKHVPMMEENAYEALRTNVLGTKLVAEKARDFNVERFILISTDKAVNPVSVMGITKKIAEQVVCDLSENHGTRYSIVRFGNVLESSGSVVPLFREQIKKGGPVTVTHPEATRYFMTVSEAVHLVLQAATMGNGKSIFILEMGKAVKILDLAKRMISIYGYRPGREIDVSFIGLRPGEKLTEELFNRYETIEKTPHPKIHMALSNGKSNSNMLTLLASKELNGNNSHVKRALQELVQSLHH